MLCQICSKANATVHLTEIINDQMTEIHLCEKCAKEKGIAGLGQPFGLQDLLAGLVDFGAPIVSGEKTLLSEFPRSRSVVWIHVGTDVNDVREQVLNRELFNV